MGKSGPEYILFASGGNDSVALVQWAYEEGLANLTVVYSNTGWASPVWPQRMARFKEYVQACGFEFAELQSEGMDALITRKQAFPANRPKFCTYELKIKPALAWMDQVDHDREAVCLVGVRREESKERANWPYYVESSESHGGRSLSAPLAGHTEAMRDALLARAGWEPLPHRSKECSPCVNANRADFRHLEQADIDKVRDKERRMGLTMFRPYRFMGAKGIDEVMKWAWSERGQYEAPTSECDSGMCGD